MAEPKPVINIGKVLAQQDLEFAGMDEAGNYLVTDLEGRTGKFNVDKFFKSKNIDRSKIDFSMNTPDEPVDTSPVEVLDRAKLSLGNKAGSIDYLKQKFDAVKYNPEGELVVKKAGVWHRVDPESMGSNPWEMTKELVADLADVSPTVGLVGASLAAGAATGGSSLFAQAVAQGATGGAVEGIRTSLGRAVGTYKATAEEQIADIGLEMLMNFGGQYAAAGISTAGKSGVGMLRKAAQNLSKANPEGQGVIASVLGPVVAGADNVDRLIKNPTVVTGHLDKALAAGKSEAEAIQHLVQGQVDDLVEIATKADDALSTKWNQNVSTLTELAPEAFDPATQDVRKSMLASLLQRGLVRIEDKVGRRVGNTVVRPAILNPEELMTKNLDDLNIRLFSYDELIKGQQRSGIPNKFANSKEAYQMVSEFYEMLQRNMKLNPKTGKAGVHQLLGFKQAMSAKTWELSKKAKKNDLGFAGAFFTDVDSVMDTQINNIFNRNGMGQAWTKLNSEYSTALSELRPLLNAKEAAVHSNNLLAFQPELTRILSPGANNLGNKTSLKSALKILNDPELIARHDSIFDRNAAKAFVPKFGPYAKAAGAAAVGSAVSLNPMTALAFAGSAVGTSPRLVGRMLAKSAGAGDAVEIGFKKLDFLKKVAPAQREALVNNPALLNSFLQTGAEALQLKQKTHEALMGQAMQVAQPVAPPAQFLQQQRGKGK